MSKSTSINVESPASVTVSIRNTSDLADTPSLLEVHWSVTDQAANMAPCIVANNTLIYNPEQFSRHLWLATGDENS